MDRDDPRRSLSLSFAALCLALVLGPDIYDYSKRIDPADQVRLSGTLKHSIEVRGTPRHGPSLSITLDQISGDFRIEYPIYNDLMHGRPPIDFQPGAAVGIIASRTQLDLARQARESPHRRIVPVNGLIVNDHDVFTVEDVRRHERRFDKWRLLLAVVVCGILGRALVEQRRLRMP